MSEIQETIVKPLLSHEQTLNLLLSILLNNGFIAIEGWLKI